MTSWYGTTNLVLDDDAVAIEATSLSSGRCGIQIGDSFDRHHFVVSGPTDAVDRLLTKATEALRRARESYSPTHSPRIAWVDKRGELLTRAKNRLIEAHPAEFSEYVQAEMERQAGVAAP